MPSEYYMWIWVAIIGGAWIFCLITLGLFFHDVFYEDDVEKGEGWTKPKNDTSVILFVWVLAPLTLIVLVTKSCFTSLKRHASA